MIIHNATKLILRQGFRFDSGQAGNLFQPVNHLLPRFRHANDHITPKSGGGNGKSSIDQVVNALRSVNLFDLEVEVSKEGLFDGQQKEGLATPKRYDGESTMMKVKALFESPG
jgi:hypothetical protein